MYKYLVISVVLICMAYNCFSQTMPSNNDLFRISRTLHDYHGPSIRTDSIKFDDRLEVVLANDSIIRVKGELSTRDARHFYLQAKRYKPNKGKINPGDTKQISKYTYSGSKITGIAADSCWLFKVEKGRINSYSYYPDEYPGRIVAIQKGNGPVVPYNKHNLLGMVSDDSDVVKVVEEGLYRKAIDMYNHDDY